VRGSVIVANAPWRWTPPLVALVREAECVLAADGGGNHLARVGIRPRAVVGDLDSLRPGVRRWVGEAGIVARPDQDSTDLDKTLAYAVEELGLGALTVLAALGGRPDHAFANLGLLVRWSRRCQLRFVDPEVCVVAVEAEAALATVPGQTVSLLPMGRCEQVWASELAWPLAGDALDIAGRQGISNRATASTLHVRVQGGALLVFLGGC
jgi:thiamine pyrophosphokinase